MIPDTPKKTAPRCPKNKKHKLFRKRAGIKSVIEHCKADHRLGRNFYRGLFGNSINVVLAVAAYNFKRPMRLLLCLIERVIIWCCGRLNLNFQSQFTPLVLWNMVECLFESRLTNKTNPIAGNQWIMVLFSWFVSFVVQTKKWGCIKMMMHPHIMLSGLSPHAYRLCDCNMAFGSSILSTSSALMSFFSTTISCRLLPVSSASLATLVLFL